MLIVPDFDAETVETARLQSAATAVAAGDIHRADADVYAPCALGAVLNPATIPEIRARIVAGAANNQLSNPSQDRVLRARGVTYCPDYVVNAGGVLSVADKDGVFTRAAALKRVATILATTRRVLALAETENIPTGEAADRMVHRRLRT